MSIPIIQARMGLSLSTTASKLGPLADLAGTWVGKGFNLISLPDFSSPSPSDFRLKLNATAETLQFTPIGAAVPNRGRLVSAQDHSLGGQPDIFLFGLTYLQRVSDAVSSEALHIEPGIWIHVPATTVLPPHAPQSVVRMGTIPHGDSVLAQSNLILTVPAPEINPVSALPFTTAPDVQPHFKLAGYLDAFGHSDLPPGIKQAYVTNPNQLLLDDNAALAEKGQKIVNTVVISISTKVATGGILNIPFVTENAAATDLEAIFWIETVQQVDGSTFMRLQYTQTVILQFLKDDDGNLINWPHISVATLIKQ